ncbi:Uncharacterized protein C5orf42, partial [Merops nubicus]
HRSPTSKDIKLFQKKKEEKDKALLSKHHSMRISQALSLMNEMLSEAVALPANEQRPLSTSRSPQEYRESHVASTKSIQALLLLFSSCRGHPNSPALSERRKFAAKPSLGPEVHHFTPALGLTQSRGKNNF